MSLLIGLFFWFICLCTTSFDEVVFVIAFIYSLAFCFIFCLCFCLLIVCFCIHSIVLSLGSMILLSVRLYANICVLYLHLFLVCSCVLSFVCFLSWGWCLSVCLLFVRSTVCSLVTSFVCLPTPFCFFMVYLSEILVGPFVDLFIPRFISFCTQTFLVIIYERVLSVLIFLIHGSIETDRQTDRRTDR